MKDLFLGIDTSNYTSSFALVDDTNQLIKDVRIPLKVKHGERGLRQSDAVFQHINNLEEVSTHLLEHHHAGNIRAVAASIAPRSVKGSYMPVFTVSKNIGKLISSILCIPFFATTHQLGHIRNAISFSSLNHEKPFIAIHFSGGTSEVLSVYIKNHSIRETIIGKTIDITAGQLVDRIGVLTGLPFPSGKYMEEIAKLSEINPIKSTYYFKDGNFSYSGVETTLKKIIEKEAYPKEVVYHNVFINIAESIEKSIKYHCKKNNIQQVLLFGGVLANQIIKDYLIKRFEKSSSNLFFCNENYSCDNAVGVAHIAKDNYGGKL